MFVLATRPAVNLEDYGNRCFAYRPVDCKQTSGSLMEMFLGFHHTERSGSQGLPHGKVIPTLLDHLSFLGK